MNPDYVVRASDNWYLMAALVPLYTLLGTVVNDAYVEPYLGSYHGQPDLEVTSETMSVDPAALRWAVGSFVVMLLGIAVLSWPEESLLRDAEGTLKPLLDSTVTLVFLLFLVSGLVYGIRTGEITSDEDVIAMMTGTVEELASYIVMVFAAAVALALFEWSKLGVVLAVKGADFLRFAGLEGISLLVGLFLLTALLNLLIGSASAKWALLAPVFVPMMMSIGYAPELTQAVYRIGDSVTNILTPLLPYFPLIIVFARRYDQDVNIGTIIALMIPYSIAFAIGGMGLLCLWFALGWPLGPGARMLLT